MRARHPRQGNLIPWSPKAQPVSPAVLLLLRAEEMHRAGNLAGALQLYFALMTKLGKGNPVAHRAMFLTGLVCFQSRIYDEAVLLMEEYVRCEWENPDGHYNLGLFYGATGRPADAAECYRTCLALKPSGAAAENNLGNVLKEMGDVEGAELCYRRLLEREPTDPEARYNLSHVVLLRGDLAKGFHLYESRWSSAGWNAEYGRRDVKSRRLPIDARPQIVFVHQEQGIGDTLQFLRYLPLLVERGHQVHFEAPRELWPWIRRLERPGLTFSQRGDPIPAHDSHIALLSIPNYLHLRKVDELPDVEALQRWGEEDLPPVLSIPVRVPCPLALDPDDERPVVGFAWAGNVRHHNDRYRSAALEQLVEMFKRPNTRFVSLQVGARGVELLAALPSIELGEGSEIVECSALLTDFEQTAALIQRCDAVVTVDTSIAHLAGSLGVRTLILTSWLSEWRWQLDRTDSPWYPSVELVRQPSLGDWPATARRVLDLLEGL